MNLKQIKAELRELFIQAMKLEGDVANLYLSWAKWESGDLGDIDGGPPEWLIDETERLERPFESLVLSLYLTTVCYLDANELHAYLNQFYQKFGEKFDVKTAVSNFEIDTYWSGEPYNLFVHDIKKFLQPLDIVSDSEVYLRHSGIHYLETILRNTAAIIHKGGVNPTSEPQVYKSVKHVLEAVFVSAKFPKSNFFKTAQEYKPDILIPQLSAAVEYKYAEEETKLKACIAQISDDVKGYTGDDDYNLFYAVFYVKNDFWGVEKFKVAWEEKGFPKNWRAFYIVGK